MTNETWTTIREGLSDRIGKNNYTTWIEPLALAELVEGVARFDVPTNFFGDWVGRNFSEHILRHLNENGMAAGRVEFSLTRAARSPAARAAATLAAPVQAAPRAAARSKIEDDLPGSNLDPKLTFDTFVVGKPNELAHAAARRVAEGGPVSFNPLFLYGGVGLGKTHLMHAIAHELQANRPELRVVYLSAEQFMYRFVQSLRDKSTMDFKEIFRSVDVLMVDDLQFIAGKDSTQEEFFHTFNALVIRAGRSSCPPTARPPRSRTWKTASSRACNPAWWSICTRPTTNCGSASCSKRRNITAGSIADW